MHLFKFAQTEVNHFQSLSLFIVPFKPFEESQIVLEMITNNRSFKMWEILASFLI